MALIQYTDNNYSLLYELITLNLNTRLTQAIPRRYEVGTDELIMNVNNISKVTTDLSDCVRELEQQRSL